MATQRNYIRSVGALRIVPPATAGHPNTLREMMIIAHSPA